MLDKRQTARVHEGHEGHGQRDPNSRDPFVIMQGLFGEDPAVWFGRRFDHFTSDDGRHYWQWDLSNGITYDIAGTEDPGRFNMLVFAQGDHLVGEYDGTVNGLLSAIISDGSRHAIYGHGGHNWRYLIGRLGYDKTTAKRPRHEGHHGHEDPHG